MRCTIMLVSPLSSFKKIDFTRLTAGIFLPVYTVSRPCRSVSLVRFVNKSVEFAYPCGARVRLTEIVQRNRPTAPRRGIERGVWNLVEL